ncbi:MAG: hypothetical protein IJ644_09710 [Oscillospiraceae bacterium]|nr:hypothetical protein [Oscillospiraceae bacterium]
MKEYIVKYVVTDSVAEELNQACEILKKKGYCFSEESMFDLAINYSLSVEKAVKEFCRYAERVSAKNNMNSFPELDFIISEDDLPF